MRITNKVMQNNALTNINRNKEMQDNLNTQLSTGKKIYKPSEDPVTAIRALRLRSDVSQVQQYYKKNVPDANSWIELTESAAKTTISVIKDMIQQCEKGANDTLTTSDRQTIINSLKQLREEVYSTGNADYAGRYIFTGYRTETPLTFTENSTDAYQIWERFDNAQITQEKYISTNNNGTKLQDISETNYDGTSQMTEQDIQSYSYYRVRLAYDNLNLSSWSSGLNNSSLGTLRDELGNQIMYSTDMTNDKEQAYKDIAAETGDKMILVGSTGELLLSNSLYEKIKKYGGSITLGYSKDSWNEGDLIPQHYFACQKTDTSTTPAAVIKYNQENKDGDLYFDIWQKEGNPILDQSIEYQVGFAQNIRVNTTAGEVYNHATGRDVDELIDLANQLEEVEKMQTKLKNMTKDSGYTTAQQESIAKDLAAADKAVTLLKSALHDKFSSTITSMQSYLDDANEALTSIGNRSSRLKLVENRLTNQNTTFKTLQSENEDADATEVAVQLSSAQVSYEAALMATSDMIQKTLLNYL